MMSLCLFVVCPNSLYQSQVAVVVVEATHAAVDTVDTEGMVLADGGCEGG